MISWCVLSVLVAVGDVDGLSAKTYIFRCFLVKLFICFVYAYQEQIGARWEHITLVLGLTKRYSLGTKHGNHLSMLLQHHRLNE